MEPTSTQQDAATDVAGLSYEQARDELVSLVSRIESGQVPLEDAMTLWERGEALAAHCQTKLDAAQETLDRATAKAAAGRAPNARVDTDVNGDKDTDPDGDADTGADAATDVDAPDRRS